LDFYLSAGRIHPFTLSNSFLILPYIISFLSSTVSFGQNERQSEVRSLQAMGGRENGW
jgi:hypothetical protein